MWLCLAHRFTVLWDIGKTCLNPRYIPCPYRWILTVAGGAVPSPPLLEELQMLGECTPARAGQSQGCAPKRMGVSGWHSVNSGKVCLCALCRLVWHGGGRWFLGSSSPHEKPPLVTASLNSADPCCGGVGGGLPVEPSATGSLEPVLGLHPPLLRSLCCCQRRQGESSQARGAGCLPPLHANHNASSGISKKPHISPANPEAMTIP